ncbi:hypothetical protein [Rhizobium sp. Root1204]|uniref:hypothetical protein n=1 Tax=Rhizobium sp. Root1204 TaxID=1736428 RepID=UPI000713878F|nr:hypothetical protein [Rhizobium sp. Root1204]KQV32889.1 hypothetical protein ASC96_30810 [Rhizobium sp. Root1204]
MIKQPKFPASHEDRHLLCQEEVDGPLQDILDQATTHGWGTLETISAMEEVLKNMRIAYAEDPDPAEDPPNDSGDAIDFGAFPSADRLVDAYVRERGKS